MIIVSTTLSDRDSFTVRASDSENVESTVPSTSQPVKKDLKFWLIFASMSSCLFLSALELLSVSTALPTIAHELRASQFVWVGSAYALSSTAFLPMSGGLAQAFGRRPAMLITIGLFALGSGICGGATSMNMLIAGRTIQGLGGGGIQSVTSIILADIVPLQERGIYLGLFGLTWCFAASIGPIVGGSLAEQGKWRWLFYLNLPIAFIGSILVFLFLNLPTPPGKCWEKLGRMDWIGNLLVIASTVAYTIGLTWGGTTAPWISAVVLVPLVLGIIGLTAFIAYEATFATHPLLPLTLLTNVTSISGYIQSFCMALNMMGVVYFFPVYFQACKGVSPILSGVYILCLCTFAPASILTGLSVKVTGRYRPQMWSAWAIVLVAMCLLSSSTIGTGISTSLAYLVLLGLGTGGLYATAIYPIQAPLPVTENAHALAWMWFIRSFAAVWGITIGSAILQNELSERLPAPFRVRSESASALYGFIPEFSTLPPHLRSEIETAFADSLRVLWKVLSAVCAVGGLASLCMKGLSLSHALDADWAIKRSDEERDQAAPVTSPTVERV